MNDKSLRTLIVDDSEDDVLLIIRELKKGGYNPVYERVETAAKMKKALLENQWDIILCDYRLPRFNAPSAIALLKETNLNTPVIIISGKIGEETAVECMRLGAKDYILKDNLIRLCPAIARELEEAKVRQREKKAEEALRESERKYQLLFDNSIDAIAVFGGKPPKFLFVNPAFLRLFGYTLEEILAFSPDDIFLTIHPDDREMVKEHLRDRFRQEDNYNRYEFRVVTKDGQVRWVEISATLFSKNGQFLSQAICRDITERKWAEERLFKSEKKFSSVFHLNSDPMVISDIVTEEIIDVNQAYIDWTGYSREEIIGAKGKTLHLWIKADDRKKIIDKLKAEGEVNGEEIWARQRNGNIRNVLISARFIEIEHQFCVLIFGHDITDRKRAEEALRNSHRRLEDIIDFLPDATFAIDREGKVVAWNKSIEQVTEISKANMIGRGNYEYALPFYGERRPLLVDLALLPDDVFENIHYENVYRQGDTLFAETYVPRTYGGKGAFMWGTASRLRDKSGNIIGAIESIRDITENRRKDDELRESEEKYRQIFDNAPTAIYRIDFKSGKLLKANDIICEYIGCKQEEITSFSPYDILTEESKQLFLERVEKMALGIEVPNTVEYEIIDIKGRRWCLQLHNKNIYDAEGHVVAADVVANDITERKRMEEEIRKSEEKYRRFFKTSRDCVFITSIDGRWLDMNDAAVELFDYSSRDELMQVKIPDLYVKNEERTKIVKTILADGFVKDYPIDMRRKDGAVINTLLTSTVRYDAAGNAAELMGTIKDITKRKKAEELLSKSEAKYRNIFENAMEGIYQTTMEGRFITANTAIAHMAGYDSSEELIESVKNIATQLYVHPEDRQRVLEIGAKKGFAKSVEVEFYKKNGSIFWVEINARIVRNEQGDILYIEGFIQDITIRKQVQEILSKSERKFASLFKLNPDSMTISEIATGKYIDVNEAFTNWTGYSREEVIGVSDKNLRLWVNSGDRKKIIGTLSTVAEEVNGIEVLMRHKNGHIRNVLFSARFIEIDQQFYLLMSGHDITDRKRIEEKLRKSELTFRSLFEASPIGIFTVIDRIFTQVNPAMCKATGYSLEDLIGHSVRICYWNDEEYERTDKMLYGEIMQEGVGVVETRLRRRNGEEFDALVCLNPIDPQDNSIGYEGIMMDITERKRSEEEIERTHEQMRAFATQLQMVREEERTRIAREIHDELGGALTGIKIDFSLLKKAAAEIKEKALKNHLFDQMHSTTKLIDKTIGTVRKISTELRPGILDDLGILAALEWQLDDFRKRTNTHCEWISSLENINLEEQETTAMFRIFQETLINVARHAGATAVKVQLRKEENAYFLEIEDNGKGITKKNIDDKRSLGLLGMRERALAVGGRINIKGHPGKGTKVTVEIPIRQTGKNKTDEEGSAQ